VLSYRGVQYTRQGKDPFTQESLATCWRRWGRYQIPDSVYCAIYVSFYHLRMPGICPLLSDVACDVCLNRASFFTASPTLRSAAWSLPAAKSKATCACMVIGPARISTKSQSTSAHLG
jgi:hypothetical protein